MNAPFSRYSKAGLLLPGNIRTSLGKLGIGACCCPGANGTTSPNPNSPVIVENHVFVSLGATQSGIRERLDRPFPTIAAGLAALQSGDTLSLMPGTYLLPAPLDLPALAVLTIEGWGSSNNVIIQAPGATAFRTIATGQNSLLIRDLSVLAPGGIALDLGSVADDRFVQGRLEIRDVIVTGDTRLRRVGIALLESVDLATLNVLGSGSVEVRDATVGDVNLDYLSASAPYTTAIGRAGYRFSNVEANILALAGTPAFAADKSTRARLLNGNLRPTTDPQNLLNPSIRYAGTIGAEALPEGNHRETNSLATSTQAVVFNFQDVPWAPGGSYTSGVDLSDSTIFGGVRYTFQGQLVAPLDPGAFVFGGEHARILGTIVLQAPVPPTPAGPRYLFTLRNSIVGRPGAPVTVQTDEVDVDLRGGSYADAILSSSGGAGFDRNYVVVGITTTLNTPGGTYPISPPFPYYVGSNLIPIFTPNDVGGSTGVTGTADAVTSLITYKTTSAGDTGIALMRS